MADITAEQVARAIEAARSDEGGISDALGGWQWDKRAPDYVRVAWGKPSLPDFIAALTRWHAELVAAETPRKAPDDTAPERLRERREALGKDDAWIEHILSALDVGAGPDFGYGRERRIAAEGVSSYTEKSTVTMRAAYAAALSAEEERRGAQMLADEEARAAAFHAKPERPAPRFKVGDWVRVVSNGTVYQVGEIATPFGGAAYYFRETGGAENSWQAAALEPASPPAPEVVDVPQPALPLPWLDDLARRLTGMAEHFARQAKHGGRAWESNALSETACRDGVEAVTALRAMLEAIDAQQGGAS